MLDEFETLAAESRTDEPRAATSPDELATDQTQLAEVTGGRRSDPPTRRGTLVGRYVIVEEVGRGAMGVVYSAYDPKLDRKVAIKLLLADAHGRRALGEAQALAKLNHPNVVKVYDVGEHGERVFMAMEFVVGRPLGTWREQTEPTRELCLDVFRRAAQGLAAAHDAGLVHRDFKPDNVMIADDGRVLVMDFGLAVSRDRAAKGADKLWASGTPAYMSPEQFANGEVGPKSDQFSFFVALYEALAGERPFPSDTVMRLVAAVTNGELRHATPLRGEPAWLRRLVLQGLEVEPEARLASMQAVVEALERGMSRRGRQLGIGAAGLALLGSLSGWALVGEREDPAARACTEQAQSLARAWTEDWRGEARELFERGLEADGAQLWKRVESELDSFSEAWAGAYGQACAGHFVSQTLAAPEFDQRRRCLEGQRAYVESLLGGLERADAEALREIAAVSTELPNAASCETDARGAGDFDADSQAQVAEARLGLMRAQGRADAGANAEARAEAEAVLASLAEFDAPVTRSELSSLLARVSYEAGELDEGRELQRAAIEAAARSQDPQLVAEAWLARLEQLATHDQDFETAQTLLEAAEVAVAALPEDPKLGAELESLRGVIALKTGRNQDAHDAFARALATAQEAELGARMLAQSARRLGAAKSRLGEVEAARALFERSAELAKSILGERHSMVVGNYTNLGLLCRREGDRACARANFERAISLASDPRQRASNLVFLGQLIYDEGELEQAQRLAEQAVEIYEDAYGELHPDLTAPRLLLSHIFRRLKQPEAALEQARRLVEIAEQSTPEGHPKRAIALSSLGQALRMIEQYEEALAAHERALAMRRETLDAGDPRIGYSLCQTADLLEKLERETEAAALAREAIALFDVLPGTETWQASARFTLARSLGRGEESSALAQKALSLYQGLGPGSAGDVDRVRAWIEGG